MLDILKKQREFFKTNSTLDVNFRLTQLKRLKAQIKIYYEQICEALKKI